MTQTHSIERAVVIGAGTMGAGIAAHLANAGAAVTLLDVVPDAAAKAIAALPRSRPPALMADHYAQRITPAALSDGTAALATADLIVEAVVEDLAIKRDLLHSVAHVMHADAIVTSNTSTLALADLAAGQPTPLPQRFAITHFFNPPRHMPLMELVTGPDADPDVPARLRAFGTHALGKTVLDCRDTPGFIANRIGTFWLEHAGQTALKAGLPLEVADALFGAPLGMPRTGVFGLNDLIGLDVLSAGVAALRRALDPQDALSQLDAMDTLRAARISQGATGRKSGAGFYAKGPDGTRLTLDPASGAMRPAQTPPTLPRLDALLAEDTATARVAAKALSGLIAYCLRHGPEIAHSPGDIDRAMELGYGWRAGPFRLANQLGPDWRAAHGITTPKDSAAWSSQQTTQPTDPRLLSLPQIAKNPPVIDQPGARLWDAGGGRLVFGITEKGQVLTPAVLGALDQSLDRLEEAAALVIGGHAPNFSSGADLSQFALQMKTQDWDAMTGYAAQGRAVMRRIAGAGKPVIAALRGVALGGGCELAMHCRGVVAHADAQVGLVEVTVGTIPAWGGAPLLLRTLLDRGQDPAVALQKAYLCLLSGRPTHSAQTAIDSGLLSAHTCIVAHPQAVLHAALQMAADPPPARSLDAPLPSAGVAGREALAALPLPRAKAPFDGTIAAHLAAILTGGRDTPGPVTPGTLAQLETDAALALAATPEAQNRVAHMMRTRAPLMN